MSAPRLRPRGTLRQLRWLSRGRTGDDRVLRRRPDRAGRRVQPRRRRAPAGFVTFPQPRLALQDRGTGCLRASVDRARRPPVACPRVTGSADPTVIGPRRRTSWTLGRLPEQLLDRTVGQPPRWTPGRLPERLLCRRRERPLGRPCGWTLGRGCNRPLGQPPRNGVGERPVGRQSGRTRGRTAARPRQRVGVPLRGRRGRTCRPASFSRPGSPRGLAPGWSRLPAMGAGLVVGRGVRRDTVPGPAGGWALHLAGSPIRAAPPWEGRAVLPVRDESAALPVRGGSAALPVGEGGAVLPVREGSAALPRRVGRAVPGRALGWAGLAEVPKPVVVGIRRTEWVSVVAEPAAAETAAWLRHGPNRQRPARVRRSELGAVAANLSLWAGLGSEWASAPSSASSVVDVSRGPSTISLILRPTRCHTECYS